MDGSSLIVGVMPIMALVALVTGVALPFIAANRAGRSHTAGRLAHADSLKRISTARRKARPRRSGANNAAPAGYLYVPCTPIRHDGYLAQTRRWGQQVPIVKKTAKWIYYTSGTWDRNEAVVSPGRISREEFETATRCRDNWQAAPEAPPIKELRRAMADAHPDRGGTADQFIEARRRYRTALRPARR